MTIESSYKNEAEGSKFSYNLDSQLPENKYNIPLRHKGRDIFLIK